jgi:hypothetical protein
MIGVDLYSPPDTETAWEAWRCNCGPSAVAALAGVTCADVRPHFPGHDRRGYANPTHLAEALRSVGLPFTSRHGRGLDWPAYGLAFVQWGGPWLAAGVPIGAAHRHTHTVAVAALTDGSGTHAVYDVNVGHWVSGADWRDPRTGVAAEIMRTIPRSDGTWFTRATIDVRVTAVAAFRACRRAMPPPPPMVPSPAPAPAQGTLFPIGGARA